MRVPRELPNLQVGQENIDLSDTRSGLEIFSPYQADELSERMAVPIFRRDHTLFENVLLKNDVTLVGKSDGVTRPFRQSFFGYLHGTVFRAGVEMIEGIVVFVPVHFHRRQLAHQLHE